jgi:hypothetical protein
MLTVLGCESQRGEWVRIIRVEHPGGAIIMG